MSVKRRDIILSGAAMASGAAVIGALNTQSKKPVKAQAAQSPLASPNINRGLKQFRLATTWPKDFPGLGQMPNRFSKILHELSAGAIDVKVYAAGELVAALECFNATSTGAADMYHGAEYYWQGQSRGFSFFTAVPMGMMASEIMGWVEHGGGQALWDKLSAQFNIKPLQAGNTGHQMGGWFKREINSLEDFKGLKMRIPGLAGEVIRRLGGAAARIPGGEIYQALQSGAIDATEWVGPWNDYAFGFYREAPYYYAPGFHEAGAALAIGINLDIWNSFNATEQAMIKYACKAVNDISLGEYNYENAKALKILKEQENIIPRYFSDDIMNEIGRISEEVIREFGSSDAQTREIYDSYFAARNSYRRWTEMGDGSYIRARKRALDNAG